MRYYRIPFILIIAGILSAVLPAQSGSLNVELRDDKLYVSAPQLHFIAGKAVEKLHNGSSVTYIIVLTAMAEHTGTPVPLFREQFMVSYDLWEEKYSVVRKGQDGRAVSRLTAAMAETWCLENMPIPLQVLPEKVSFMIRLECSIVESEPENGENKNSVLSLANLIDVFSRKEKEESPRWEASAGPLRLDDLKSVKHSQ